MKSIPISFFILVSLLAWSCSSQKDFSSENKKDKGDTVDFNRIDNPDVTMSLADLLRRVAGVSVSGDGDNATVTIRGISSINASSEPLFVIDGHLISGGFRGASQMITVNQIKSIKVLKNASETAIYGLRGANGVIEITLK